MGADRTKRTALAFGAAAALAAAAVPGWAAAASPQYRADQIAAIEDADLEVGAEPVLVQHEDAAFIKVRFADLRLGERDALTVSGPGEAHVYRAADVEDGELWALSVEGDTAEVSLRDADDGVAAVGRVAEYSRGLNEDELASRPAGDEPGPESVCGRDDSRDAVCYQDSEPAVYGAAASVARIIIDGESYCTAWLAGENRLLTNNHCIDDERAAAATEVQFGFECAECGGGEVRTSLKVAGGEVLRTDSTLDFTLFTVDDPEGIADLPVLPISSDATTAGKKIFIPGHPAGQPMRIALDSTSEQNGTGSRCQVQSPRVDGRGWGTDLSYLCDTQGGSSGSPVIDRATGEVVGIHHFGGCPNQAVRMDRILPYIEPFLEYEF